MAILLILIVSVMNLYAQESARQPKTDLRSMIQNASSGGLKLVKLNNDGTIGLAVGTNSETSTLVERAQAENERSVSLAARAYVGMLSANFGLAENAELREEQTLRVGNVWNTSFGLFYNGIPLRERTLHLTIGIQNGNILALRSNLPSHQPNASQPKVDSKELSPIIEDIMGSGCHTEQARLVYIDDRTDGTLKLCYEFISESHDGMDAKRFTFDALNGHLLEKKDLIITDCFKSHPDVSVDDLSMSPVHLQQPMNGLVNGQNKITAQVHPATPYDNLVTVSVPNLDVTINDQIVTTDSSGNWNAANLNMPFILTSTLNGPYLTVMQSDSTQSVLRDTLWSNNDVSEWNNTNSLASERDAFYSLTYAHRYVRTLDPKLTRLDQPMIAVVNYSGSCNAMYIPNGRRFVFLREGPGCSNTAQIADVVYHEFGHRVNHARYSQAAGSNVNINDGSLNEGFADVISALMRDDPRIGRSFFGNTSRILRTIENTRQFPRDISTDPHISGLIVAGAFWDLRKAIGLKETERLFHQMCYLRPDGIGSTDADALEDAFTSVLISTLITDDDDNNLQNGTPHFAEIINAFEKHNITLAGLIELTAEQTADQDTSAVSYPVRVNASYNALVGEIDPNSVKVYYRNSGEQTYRSVIAAQQSPSSFQALIPKMNPGSIVEYYAECKTTVSDIARKEFPSKNTPMNFLVGFTRVLYDDCETDNNWTIGDQDDDAKKGLWTFGKPFGTYYSSSPNTFVQQDTDKSPNGIHCFITGNYPAVQPQIDDIDSGTTTLYSPIYDVSLLKSPYIRYAYYFTNNSGSNPGIAEWNTYISINDGEWEQLHRSISSTDGWTQFGIPLHIFHEQPLTVRLKFVGADNIGAIVEAGVDDIEIFDYQGERQTGSVVSETQPNIFIYPNPLRSGNTIQFDNPMHSSNTIVSLTTLLGENILQQQISTGRQEVELPSSLANGVYIVEIRNAEIHLRRKLVIAR